MSKVILYARVSIVDQTIGHQRTQAEAAGFTIDEVVAAHELSGVSPRLPRKTLPLPRGRLPLGEYSEEALCSATVGEEGCPSGDALRNWRELGG